MCIDAGAKSKQLLEYYWKKIHSNENGQATGKIWRASPWHPAIKHLPPNSGI